MISSKTGLLSSLVCPKLFDLPFVRIWKTSQNKTQTPLSRFKILYVFLFFFFNCELYQLGATTGCLCSY
jgi:hypothetical protein